MAKAHCCRPWRQAYTTRCAGVTIAVGCHSTTSGCHRCTGSSSSRPSRPVCVSRHLLVCDIVAAVACLCLQVPGDGRELVVMVPEAVKVSAEDGRRVEVRRQGAQAARQILP